MYQIVQYRKSLILAAVIGLLLSFTIYAQADGGLTRTPWEMHDGLEVGDDNPLGLVDLTCTPTIHGDICEYDDATIPPADDPGWGPAPDGEIIDFSIYSRVCEAPVTCLEYADFTYFQTFVNIPAETVITEFTISFQGMDDGSRITIFNSLYPSGLVLPGSYVFLGGTGTSNLADFVVDGELNRVVITQVDDCCSGNNLREARVVINGEAVSAKPDSDGDGIADEDDQCLDTAADEIVDETGCSINDYCSADGAWKNHGKYVSCVSQAAEYFLDLGLITEEEKDATVSEAAQSDVGKKKK
jgi:hypothetical protein